MKINYLVILLLTGILGSSQLAAQSLSLDSCKAYALENNKRIREARLKVSESEEVERNAFTNFFPKVDAQLASMYANDYLLKMTIPSMDLPVYDGNAANLDGATQYANLASQDIKTLDYLNLGMLTATQPIYAGGRIRSGYQLAGLGKEISQQSLELSTQEVVVKTEQYYWTLVALKAKKQTLESYRELLNQLLNDVQVSFDAGLLQKSDLLKVELRINEINANSLKLNNGISLTKMALCQHIGIAYSESVDVKDTGFVVSDPRAIYIAPSAALGNRAEYQLLNKAIEAEMFQKKLARGEYLPQLAVGLTGQYLDVADQHNTYGIAFATLSIPISDWWGGSHKLKEHELKVEMARNNRDEKSELLQLQMEKAYKELTESYQQIAVSESLAQQAQEHLKVVRDNYEAGIMSTSDLLEAQAIYQESQDGLVNAQSNYQIQQIYYQQAVACLIY